MTASTYSYSTQSSIKILQLQDHVPEYFMVIFVNELLSYVKHLLMFVFFLGNHETSAIQSMALLVGAQCLTRLSGSVASSAFELISPRIGTTFSSAGKIVYNYCVLQYFLLSIIFYIVFALLRSRENLSFYLLGSTSYALESFLQAISRVERWNGAQMVSAVLCPCTQIAALAVLLISGAEPDVSTYFAYITPTFVFSMILLFQKKYLRLKPSLLRPFRWHLTLELLVNIVVFIAFDSMEDILVYAGLQTQASNEQMLSLTLFYLSMRISSAASEQMYYYVVQAQRIFLITRQGSAGIKTRTLAHFVFAIFWSLLVFVCWAPAVRLLIGNRIAAITEMNEKSRMLDYSRFGALRGAAESLYLYELAYARANRHKRFVYFNEGVKSLSIVVLFVIGQKIRGNSNYCTIFNVQTLVILLLGLCGIANISAFKKPVEALPPNVHEDRPEQEPVEFEGQIAGVAGGEVELPNTFTFGDLKKENSGLVNNTTSSVNTARGFQLLEVNANTSASSAMIDFVSLEK